VAKIGDNKQQRRRAFIDGSCDNDVICIACCMILTLQRIIITIASSVFVFDSRWIGALRRVLIILIALIAMLIVISWIQ
jgi:hypothetical protein